MSTKKYLYSELVKEEHDAAHKDFVRIANDLLVIVNKKQSNEEKTKQIREHLKKYNDRSFRTKIKIMDLKPEEIHKDLDPYTILSKAMELGESFKNFDALMMQINENVDNHDKIGKLMSEYLD